ncbi:hypothetical protein ACFE33_02480 [Falsihalocynthiibacter sp. SS001]|uniref:hypothetical protein n=1 Tax=Falsihalocynthiibacter sp. SS001 TaxID=3349698 RepID=UPI0036D2F928
MLRKAGVAFRGPADLRGEGNALQDRFDFDDSQKNRAGRTAEEELAVLSKGRRRLILSEENYLGKIWQSRAQKRPPIYPGADSQIAALVPHLGGRPLTLFVAMRNPADFLVSAYSQSLLGGKIESFEDFMGDLSFQDLRATNVIRRMSLIDGASGIYVWKYENYPRNFTQIMRRLVGWRVGKDIIPLDQVVHRGLSAEAVEQVLALDSLPKEREERRELVRAARDQFPISGGNSRFMPFDEAARIDAAEVYAQDWDEILQIEGVSEIGARRKSR